VIPFDTYQKTFTGDYEIRRARRLLFRKDFS